MVDIWKNADIIYAALAGNCAIKNKSVPPCRIYPVPSFPLATCGGTLFIFGNVMSKKKNKRKQLSKKIRFEVFKRDCFTCQYCGQKSPNVILHVDHILAVAKGGTDDIMNLITSCSDCNLGKSDRDLSDDAVVLAARNQAELIQQKRQQIKMMAEWQASLADVADHEADAVEQLWSSLRGGKFTEHGRRECRKTINAFGLSETMEAYRIAHESYDDEEYALSKVNGICHLRKNPDNRGREFYYLRKIVENNCRYFFDKWRFSKEFDAAIHAKIPINYMIECAKSCTSWSSFWNKVWRES